MRYQAGKQLMGMKVVPTQEPVMTARADLVAILEELHDVLVRIDDQTVDRRSVDFAAMAERLQELADGQVRGKRTKDTKGDQGFIDPTADN
jgi:hypothetical protein